MGCGHLFLLTEKDAVPIVCTTSLRLQERPLSIDIIRYRSMSFVIIRFLSYAVASHRMPPKAIWQFLLYIPF
jgi:hypothetical protein